VFQGSFWEFHIKLHPALTHESLNLDLLRVGEMDLEQESDESNKNIDEIAYICCMYHLQVNWWFLPPPVEKAMAWALQSEIDHLDANKLENVRKFISLAIDCPIYIAILLNEIKSVRLP